MTMLRRWTLLITLILASITNLTAETSPFYWNSGLAAFHADFTESSYRLAFEFEGPVVNIREPFTGLGCRIKPFEGFIDEDTQHLGSGIDAFWSPLNFMDYSRFGTFFSTHIDYYPSMDFSFKTGMEFTISFPTLFEGSGFPMVTDILQVRIGYYSQNNSFFASVSVDLLVFLYVLEEIWWY